WRSVNVGTLAASLGQLVGASDLPTATDIPDASGRAGKQNPRRNAPRSPDRAAHAPTAPRRRLPPGTGGVGKPGDQILLSACSKSATRSSAASIPQDSRTRSSGSPILARWSAPTLACEVTAGLVIVVSTPPKLGATYGSRSASNNASTARSPPTSRKL